LIDADKPKPQPSAVDPQNHVKYIQLSCHESENLYLTDEVLQAIGTDWASAVTLIMKNAYKFGNKERKLLDVLKWDRKNEDVKNVINEIAACIDPKNVHWTVRVGKAIGVKKPSGQLAEYLSQDVVETLW